MRSSIGNAILAATLVASTALTAPTLHAQSGPMAVLCGGYQRQWDAVKGGANAAAMRRVIGQISPACGALISEARARLAAVTRSSPPRPSAPPPLVERPLRPPAPPPVVEPPWPPPQRDYAGESDHDARETKEFIVYFPYDQFAITPEGALVVQDAAQYAAAGHSGRIMVIGRADTAEDRIDSRISERRAKATADLLVADGVATASLDVSWKGDSDLAVQTGDNVSEPLNRGVSMIVTYDASATTPAPPQSQLSSADAQAQQSGRGRFIWPVRGVTIAGFGPLGEGRRNDGVDIAAPDGAPVVAAASGAVVYAGDQVPGFGNLVLVKHADGWVTAYAHLDRTDVVRGQQVAQGDGIGSVGMSGGVAQPELHFETRYAPTQADPAKPVDPLLVLPAN